MKEKLKRLIWTIEDHIKDSHYDLKRAREEKEDKDDELSIFYIQQAKQRLEMANSCLNKMDNVLRNYESKEREKGKTSEIVEEKMEAWKCIRNMLENKINSEMKEVQEMR